MTTTAFTIDVRDPDQYRVNANGRIVSPGKFEGCPDYTPTFYKMGLQGFACTNSRGDWWFDISPEDWRRWRTLQGVHILVLSEDDNGFVHVETSRTKRV